MPDTALTNQLPPRTTTSTRGSRKWATLGGRAASSSTTKIPTNDSDFNENTSKTNGHQRQSTSLFRKSSTISRTNGTPVPSDENSSPSLKKSRSLMNVLRSKFNSPAVLRRFRSKSRESTKQTVTEINGHPNNDQQPEIKQSNPEQTTTTTRKSRKRDPSPMRRLANRISQFTRHSRTISTDRQTKSPSKSTTNDSHEETRKSPSPLHNKDEVDHINACYDEIRAKYFNNNNNNTNKPNPSADDAQNRSLSTISVNGSLLSNDLLNNSQRISSPVPSVDDPLLQARRQTNIKLNCMLSGYSLTTSFANHEKLFGQNDLFKFHHYYDVGKRKYDYNFTNNHNRIFSNMKTRPMSKSIDSFRPTNIHENEVPMTLKKINILDNESLVRIENQQDVPRILADDNELVIREDNDFIQPEQNTSQYSTNIHQTTANRSDEKKVSSTDEEHDEELERNFLRAVDRALGVVNKDESDLIQSHDDIKPTETEESRLNLMQMTERALSSFNTSPLFTNDEQTNEHIDNDTELEKTEVTRPDEPLNKAELANTEVVDHADEFLYNEELSKNADNTQLANTEVDAHTDEPLNNAELPKTDNITEFEKTEVDDHTDEPLNNAELSKTGNDIALANTEVVDQTDEILNNAELPKIANGTQLANTEVEDHTDELLNNEQLPKLDNFIELEKTEVDDHSDESFNHEELSKTDNDKELENTEVVKHADEPLNNAESSTIGNDTQLTNTEVVNHTDEHLNDEELSKIDNDTQMTNTEVVDRADKHLSNEELAKIGNDTELTTNEVVDHTDEHLSNEELAKIGNDTELTTNEVVDHTDEHLSNEELAKIGNDTELTTNKVVDHTDEHLSNEELPKIDNTTELEKTEIVDHSNELLHNTELLKTGNDTELANTEVVDHTDEHSNNEELSKVDPEKSTNDDLIDEDIRSVIDELIQEIEEFLFEDSKNGQTFLVKLDEEEKIIKLKAENYNKFLQIDGNRLTEDVRTDINALIGEVNLLLKGKLKQFRGLCEANVTKSSSGDPIPLDSDLEGFWDITYPLIDKVKEKFAKLDARKAKQWAPIDEYDPDDVNNRPRVIDDRLKQLQPQQNKSSKIPITKSANDDLKKLIQERRKAAANTTNQNHDIEIFVTPK